MFCSFLFLVKRFNILFPSVEMQATNRLSIGNKYVLVRTLNEAITAVQNYLDK